MTLAHDIKLAVSMVVSDDSGELLRLIHAITILCGMVIMIVRIVLPVLEWMHNTACAWQQAWVAVRLYPVGVCGVG